VCGGPRRLGASSGVVLIGLGLQPEGGRAVQTECLGRALQPAVAPVPGFQGVAWIRALFDELLAGLESFEPILFQIQHETCSPSSAVAGGRICRRGRHARSPGPARECQQRSPDDFKARPPWPSLIVFGFRRKFRLRMHEKNTDTQGLARNLMFASRVLNAAQQTHLLGGHFRPIRAWMTFPCGPEESPGNSRGNSRLALGKMTVRPALLNQRVAPEGRVSDFRRNRRTRTHPACPAPDPAWPRWQ
jgi:hypothetical protein